MSHFILKYLFHFLLFFVVLLIGTTIPFVFDPEDSFWQFIMNSVITSGLITIVFGSIHYYRLKKTGIQKITKASMSSSQEIRIDASMESISTIQKVAKYLKIEPAFYDDQKVIVFKQYSFLGFTRIRLAFLEEGVVTVDIRPIWKTVIFDYGQGIKLAHGIRRLIET